MKAIILSAFVAATLIGCGNAIELSSLNSTMKNARTHSGAGQRCTSRYDWLECDRALTPAEANGGGE